MVGKKNAAGARNVTPGGSTPYSRLATRYLLNYGTADDPQLPSAARTVGYLMPS